MKSPDDLDVFDSEQIAITRELDLERGGHLKLVSSMILGLTAVHSAMRVVGPLEHWQRAAYEAHQAAERSSSTSSKLIAGELWRIVEYLQRVKQGAYAGIKDPEIKKCMQDIGDEMGIDLLDMIDRQNEE
jgi:hypothetical protein